MKTEGSALYHAVENNTLLNDVFFYVLHLPQLQNMHGYMVPAQYSDIVDVPAGEAIHSQSFTMSEDKEDEEYAAPATAAAAAPAAAAESGDDGAGPPAAGGAVDA
jgi:hypothetical protein